MKAIDVFFYMMVVIFISLFFKSHHTMSILISLEMISLYLFFCFLLMFSGFFFNFFILLFFLSVMACESALGLILFVFLTRAYSKDYIYFVNILKF